MDNLEIEKKQKQKLITIVISMVTVILLLVTAIAVVALGKNDEQGNADAENGEFSIIDEGEGKDDLATKEKKTEAKVVKISTQTTMGPGIEDVLPETGATDLLPLALILGVLTTGATALAMNKREA